MKKQFRVVIEDIPSLFKQFQKKNEIRHTSDGGTVHESYELGRCPLDVPAREISVNGQSNGKSYTLYANIMSARKPGDSVYSDYKLALPQKQLLGNFSTKKIGDVIIVLDEEGRDEFTLQQDYSGWIKVSTGSNGYHSFSLPPKTITTLENFEKDIRRFALLIEVTVNSIYEDLKADSPDITLYLRPQLITPDSDSLMKLLGGGINKDALRKVVEIEKPCISFSEVGGQDDAKREVQGLSFALKNPDLYRKWGTKPPKGILLVGPPGTGKTLLVRALASETDAKLLHVKVSDIVTMWYGSSEKNIQGVFDLAREEEGPCIVFFDEIDALTPNRNGSHEASQRIVSTILENMDGLTASSNVMVVASTNRPDAIDPAITRPGRIDRIVDVPLPDENGRLHIFKIHISKAEKLADRQLFNGVIYETLLRQTDGMSGADIAEIVRRVLEDKVRREGVGEETELVATQDVLREISTYERVKKTTRTLGFSINPKD